MASDRIAVGRSDAKRGPTRPWPACPRTAEGHQPPRVAPVTVQLRTVLAALDARYDPALAMASLRLVIDLFKRKLGEGDLGTAAEGATESRH